MTTTTGLTNPTTAFSGCTINSTSTIYTTSAFYGGGLNYGYIFPGVAFSGTGLSMYGNNTIYFFAVTPPGSWGVGGIYFEAGSTTTFGSTVSKWFVSNSTNSANNTNWRFNVPMYGTQSLLGCGI